MKRYVGFVFKFRNPFIPCFFSIILVFSAFALDSCRKPANVGESQGLTLNESDVHLHPGEKWLPGVSTGDGTVSPADLRWVSSDEQVAVVTDRGEINAIRAGSASVRVTYQSSSDSLEVHVVEPDYRYQLSLASLSQIFSDTLTYSANVSLPAPFRVMQSFDFDSRGNILYSQIGAANGFESGRTKAHEVYIVRSRPNISSGNDNMTLKYFGHGGNIAVDEDDGELYVWVGSNGTKYSSGEYWDEQSVSRVPYQAGKVYEGHGGESYFLNNGLLRIQAAVHRNGDLLCINATKDGARHFYTYKLSEAEALPFTSFTFTVRVGGEETGGSEEVVSRTVQGRDLSQLTPMGSFHIPVGTNKSIDVNSLPFQGYDIDASQHIYFFEGNWTASGGSTGLSQAYVTVFDINGSITHNRTRVSAISDIDRLVDANITNGSGYMEGEGIKIKGNQIYLGFASYQGNENYRRANVFKYNGTRN